VKKAAREGKVDNFFSALLGALMDPILLGSAVFAGLIPERWIRGVDSERFRTVPKDLTGWDRL
jgi:hypothetical protein